MTHKDNDSGWWRKTGETCNHDGCGADIIRYTTSDARECTEGHRPKVNVCNECGEEIMSHPRLGDICGCDN